MPQNAWGFRDEARDLIRSLAPSNRPVKARIGDAARVAGIEYWPAFDLWYAKASNKAAELFVRRIKPTIQTRTAALAGQRAREDADARDRIRELEDRLARLEERIAGMGETQAS